MNTEHSEPPVCLRSAVCVGQCEWHDRADAPAALTQTHSIRPPWIFHQFVKALATCYMPWTPAVPVWTERRVQYLRAAVWVKSWRRRREEPKIGTLRCSRLCAGSLLQCHTFCLKSPSLCVKCMEAEKKNNRAPEKCEPTNIIKIARLWQRGGKIILT